MPETTLVCRDCGATFLFTEAEQDFYKAQGFTSPPKRCRPCRQRNRERQAARGPARTGGPGGGRPAARAPHPARQHEAPRPAPAPVAPPKPRPPAGPMTPSVCSACGTPTEVPFLPDGVRPVFCLPCLKKRTR